MRNAPSVLILLLLATGGCGPSVVLPAPAGWPAEVSGRRLFHTPRAYIYASSDAAAGEAERLVESAAAEFASRGGIASKGVVLVTDPGDPALGADAKQFQRALHSSGWVGWPQEEDTRLLGMSAQQAGLAHPWQVPPDAARDQLGLPAAATRESWVVAIPTRAMIDRGIAWQGALAVANQDSPAGAVLTIAAGALFEPLVVPIRAEVTASQREQELFIAMASERLAWTDQERNHWAEVYMKRLTDQRTWYMPLTWFPPL